MECVRSDRPILLHPAVPQSGTCLHLRIALLHPSILLRQPCGAYRVTPWCLLYTSPLVGWLSASLPPSPQSSSHSWSLPQSLQVLRHGDLIFWSADLIFWSVLLPIGSISCCCVDIDYYYSPPSTGVPAVVAKNSQSVLKIDFLKIDFILKIAFSPVSE